MDKLNKKIEVKFQNIEESKKYIGMKQAKILVGYAGDNRNLTNIEKEVWEKANSESLYNIPIVGIYSDEEGKFKGHMDIEFKEDNLNFISPVPYGVVPESANVYWEEVEEEDGTKRDYMVVDGALLWTKRYPEIEKAFENGEVGQSMEIYANEYDVDDRGYTVIKNMEYSALCLLGVEPCFESAGATLFNLNKEQFKLEFSQLLNEIKKFDQEEKDNVSDNNEEIIKNKTNNNNDDDSQIKISQNYVTKDFQLSHWDIQEKLRIAVVNQFNVEKWDVWVSSNCVYETYFIYELWTENDGYKYYKANYSIDVEEKVIIDFNEVEEVQHKEIWVTVNEYESLENKYSETKKELENIKKEKENFEVELGKKDIKIQELEKVNSELTIYKENNEENIRINEINSIISEFSLLTDEEKEISKKKAINKEIDVEELRVELFAVIGKKNFAVQTQKNKDEKNPVSYGLLNTLNQEKDDDFPFDEELRKLFKRK